MLFGFLITRNITHIYIFFEDLPASDPWITSITTSSSLVIKSLTSVCLSSLCCTIRALQYRLFQQSSNHNSSSDNMSSSGSSDSSSNPSMLHGHAAYVAAAAKVCISIGVSASACRLRYLESSNGRCIPSQDHRMTPHALPSFQNLD